MNGWAGMCAVEGCTGTRRAPYPWCEAHRPPSKPKPIAPPIPGAPSLRDDYAGPFAEDLRRGLTYAEIARKYGTTRNAVIGRVHRWTNRVSG